MITHEQVLNMPWQSLNNLNNNLFAVEKETNIIMNYLDIDIFTNKSTNKF
jgi:hypothetical protein